jgi:hypothetical protein
MNTEEYIRELLARPRQYATYFNLGTDREQDEVGAAADLLDSLCGVDRIPVLERSLAARSRGNDPPDCDALTPGGDRIAIEVTELVDGESIRSQVRTGCAPPREYSKELFLARLEERLVAKRRQRCELKGGPYGICILVIHTDEMLLTHEDCRNWLIGHKVERREPWDRVYLLFSYFPRYLDENPREGRGLPYLRIA